MWLLNEKESAYKSIGEFLGLVSQITMAELTAPRHHVRERHQGCMVKKIKTARHGKVVVKTTRVCR